MENIFRLKQKTFPIRLKKKLSGGELFWSTRLYSGFYFSIYIVFLGGVLSQHMFRLEKDILLIEGL